MPAPPKTLTIEIDGEKFDFPDYDVAKRFFRDYHVKSWSYPLLALREISVHLRKRA